MLEIEGLEQLHSQDSYKIMNKKVDRWSDIVHVLCTPVSITVFNLPLLFYTTVTYFAKGLEDEDYYLPFQMW